MSGHAGRLHADERVDRRARGGELRPDDRSRAHAGRLRGHDRSPEHYPAVIITCYKSLGENDDFPEHVIKK